MAYGAAAAHGEHEHHPTGWRRWVYSTNHKDIGTMYIVLAMFAALIGGAHVLVHPAGAGRSPASAVHHRQRSSTMCW